MIFFYKFFVASAECRTNLFFVTFSLCQSVVAAVVSVLPKVQEAQSGTGERRNKWKELWDRRTQNYVCGLSILLTGERRNKWKELWDHTHNFVSFGFSKKLT